MKKLFFVLFAFSLSQAAFEELNMKDSSELNSDIENPKFKFYHLVLCPVRGMMYFYHPNDGAPGFFGGNTSYEFPLIDNEIIDKFKKEGKKFYLSINLRKVYCFENNNDLMRIFLLNDMPLYDIKLYHSGQRDDVKEIKPQIISKSGCKV